MIPLAAMEALASLNDRERMIVEERFLADPQKTLADLADRLGISVERVRQLEGQALKKMRGLLESERETLLPLLRES